MQKTRRIVQISFFLFFIVLFLVARYPYEFGIDSDLLLRFSPLIPLFEFIDGFNFNWLFWPGMIVILLTPFLGRFFCSWICPLGTMLDTTDRLIKTPSNKISNKWDKLRYLKFGILIFAVVLGLFSINVWGYLDPLSISNRVFTVIFYPLFTLFTENTFLQLANFEFIEDIVYFGFDFFKEVIMPEEQSNLQQVFWISLFFILILSAEKLSKRFWCRYLCPAGAWLGFLSQFRLYERIVGPECPVCNLCQVECKMNAIPEEEISKTNKVECIECFNCGAVCPTKINAITYRWRWKPYHSPIDFDRRKFLTTSASSVAALGLLSIGLKSKDDKHKRIRPPGSLPEQDFLNKCIKCMACVRICQSNGRCLQPDSFHDDLLQLWAPVAIMREGYCEYNCNLCGKICPTEAILPLALEVKNKTPMGLAYFDKNLCIPYALNNDCIVCEEHCPTPDKAIKFEVKDVLHKDGTTSKVKYPYVVRELCVGCGICEHKCPLPGAPGVFVTTENEKRIEA